MASIIKLEGKVSVNRLLKYYVALLVISIPIEPILSYSLRWLMIIAGLFLILFYSKKIYLNSYVGFQVCFVFLLVLSLIYSPKGAEPIGILIQYARAFIQSSVIIQLVLYLEKDTRKCVKLVLDNFTIGTVIILIYTVIVERENVFSARGFWRLGNTVLSDNGTFMILSYDIIISIIWTLFNFMDKKEGKKRYFNFSLVLLIGGVLTGTKKVFIAVGICLLVYIVLKYRRNCIKTLCGFFAVCVLLIGSYYIVIQNDFLYYRIGYRLENFILSLQDSTIASESTSTRGLMRNYGMELFMQRPILGNGVSSFRWYYQQYAGEFLYSHCNYVELLCNQGIIGCGLYYGYYIWLLFKSIKSYIYKINPIFLYTSIYLIVLFILDYAQVSYYRVHFMLMAQVIVMTITSDKEQRKQV